MSQLVNIVNLELEKVVKRLGDKKLSLSITDGAREWLAQLGYDPVYGARPLKRTIQREVETPLGKSNIYSLTYSLTHSLTYSLVHSKRYIRW